MEGHGITNHNNRDIRNRISTIQDKYRSLTDWLNQTGQGLTYDWHAEGVDDATITSLLEGKLRRTIYFEIFLIRYIVDYVRHTFVTTTS